ncbi:MAG TPA: IgGFc-binding protein [Polyangiaceae bacterium]
MKAGFAGAGAFVALVAVVAVSACGSSNHASGYSPPDGSASSSGGTSGTEGGTGDDGPSLVGEGGSSCSGTHCSTDLRSIVDCNGNVVSTCAAGQGCSDDTCIGACDAAIASKGSLGCEYYAVDPDVDQVGGACFAAYVANTAGGDITVAVDYGTQTLDASTFGYIPTGTGQSITYAPLTNATIPKGQVAILFLAGVPTATAPGLKITCPSSVKAAITTPGPSLHGTGMGTAFHIVTSGPAAAYDIFPYGGGQSALTSATLLLPTSAWDTNYVAVTAMGAGLGLEDNPFIEVVGQSNGTTVTINPTAAIKGGTGVPAAAQGTATAYTVDKGQVLQISQAAALDGSIIQSSAPVGVWGGKTSISIQACCDDSAHQQIPPVRALGSEYAGVRYRNRYAGTEESPPWRIIGGANGTTLTWEPAVPSGAPTTLTLGQVTQFNSNGPFVVRSQDAQHPFYMSAHMTGGGVYDPNPSDPSQSDGRGDAEFVNVIPPGEYQTSYVFFTDPTYPETDLVIVRVKQNGAFDDVTLDCAGALTGWQPVGTSGVYEYTRYDLVTGNFQPTGSCNNGRHEITSPAPFGVTVWGWGSAATGIQGKGFYTQYVSYAYPAGAAVAPINTVVIPPNQ